VRAQTFETMHVPGPSGAANVQGAACDVLDLPFFTAQLNCRGYLAERLSNRLRCEFTDNTSSIFPATGVMSVNPLHAV
jgi:hypothetical protein